MYSQKRLNSLISTGGSIPSLLAKLNQEQQMRLYFTSTRVNQLKREGNMSKSYHYCTFSWYNAYRLSLGQESEHYQDHIKYCRERKIPINRWVKTYNHIKTAHQLYHFKLTRVDQWREVGRCPCTWPRTLVSFYFNYKGETKWQHYYLVLHQLSSFHYWLS